MERFHITLMWKRRVHITLMWKPPSGPVGRLGRGPAGGCTGLLSMDDSNSAQRVAKAMGALEVLDEEKMVYCLPPPFSWNSSGAVIIFAEQCHDPS